MLLRQCGSTYSNCFHDFIHHNCFYHPFLTNSPQILSTTLMTKYLLKRYFFILSTSCLDFVIVFFCIWFPLPNHLSLTSRLFSSLNFLFLSQPFCACYTLTHTLSTPNIPLFLPIRLFLDTAFFLLGFFFALSYFVIWPCWESFYVFGNGRVSQIS